jgi:hypothetical protein
MLIAEDDCAMDGTFPLVPNGNRFEIFNHREELP